MTKVSVVGSISMDLVTSTKRVPQAGETVFGETILKNFKENAVLFDGVGTVPQTTGIAQITLFDDDNRIIIIPGANNEVLPDYLENFWEKIKDS